MKCTLYERYVFAYVYLKSKVSTNTIQHIKVTIQGGAYITDLQCGESTPVTNEMDITLHYRVDVA